MRSFVILEHDFISLLPETELSSARATFPVLMLRAAGGTFISHAQAYEWYHCSHVILM